MQPKTDVMRPKTLPKYLAGYPPSLVKQVHQLIEQDRLAILLLQKYPAAHGIRTDKALYDYVSEIKSTYLRNVGQVSKVMFDSRLQVLQHALGTHTSISRVQGAKLQAKREIRIASIFREMPIEFLRMIAVHEIAHMKEITNTADSVMQAGHFHSKTQTTKSSGMPPPRPGSGSGQRQSFTGRKRVFFFPL